MAIAVACVFIATGCEKKPAQPAVQTAQKTGKAESAAPPVAAPAKAQPAKEGPPMKIGVAHVSMVPEGKVPLAGYGERYGKFATGVNDPVYARAIVIESGDTRMAMVSCDLCGLTAPMCTQAAEIVNKSGCNIPADNIMVAGTHTHAGPGGYGNHPLWAIAIGNYNQKIYDKLRDSIAQSIIEASKNMRPAKLSTGSAEIQGFNRNRRGEPTVDRAMGILRFDGEDGKPIAIVVNFTGHPTIIGGRDMLMSRGWPGGLVDGVMEHYGNNVECLFFNGAQGDQSGYIDGQFESSYKKAETMGRNLSKEAIKLIDSLKPGRNPNIKVVCRRMELPSSFMSPSKLFQTESVWHRIEFDDTWLISIPGEAVCDIGLMLKQMAREKGAKLPIVVGLANDHLGYFVTPPQYAKGGYEADMCFYGPEVRKVLARGVIGDLYPNYGIADEAALKAKASVEKGSGPLRIKVQGTPYEMGYQHGALLKEEINNALAQWKPELIKEIEPAYNKAIKKQFYIAFAVNSIGGLDTIAMPALGVFSRTIIKQAPPEMYEEMRGIADGAGVHFDRIMSMNAWLTLAMQGDLEKLAQSMSLCTNVVRIPSDASKPVIHARNMDWDWAKLLAPLTTVIEYKPEKGNAFIAVTWPGMAGVLTAVNDKGLSVAVESVGSKSEATLKNAPIMFTCRQIAQSDASLDAAVSRLQKALPEGGFHVILADGKARKAASVDLCPTISVVRKPENGWLLGTILDEKQEPYVGAAFSGPGITTIDQGERAKYEFVKKSIAEQADSLATPEAWEKFMVKPDAGLCKETTIYTTIMLPETKEIRIHRVGVDGADAYFTYTLGK